MSAEMGGVLLRANRASVGRGVVSRAGEDGGSVGGSALRRGARSGVLGALAMLALLVTAASASAFTAQGSAEQVYVTGAAPSAQMALLDSGGATVATQDADSLGGLLFRNVAPGNGYRVRLTSSGETSSPVTVHSNTPKPWEPETYNQEVAGTGCTELATLGATQRATDGH